MSPAGNGGAGVMIQGAGTAAEPRGGADSLGDKGLGQGNGLFKRYAMGERGGDGRGVRAARAVSVAGGHAGGAELTGAMGREENVDGIAFEMTAFHQGGTRAHLAKTARGFVHSGEIADFETGERLGFGEVRSDKQSPRNQLIAHRGECVVTGERAAVLADKNGVDDERKPEISRGGRDGFDDGAVSQRAGFGGGGWNIIDHGAQLVHHQDWCETFDALKRDGVLHRDERDDGFAVDTELMKGFEIGLNAGATRGIGTGDGKSNGWHDRGYDYRTAIATPYWLAAAPTCRTTGKRPAVLRVDGTRALTSKRPTKPGASPA